MGERRATGHGSREQSVLQLLGVLLLTSAGLTSCAESGGAHVVSMVDAPHFARSVRRSDARLLINSAPDGQSPSTVDARRDTKLAADIRSLNLFATVEVAGQGVARWCEPVAKLHVSRIESKDVEEGRLIGSAFKSAFTFGMAQSEPAYREHLHSTVQLELQRWDGMRKLYVANGEALVEHGFDEDSAAAQDRLTTRVTWLALKQLIADQGFHLVAADRLKVTKPHVVTAEHVERLVQESARPFQFAELDPVEDSSQCGRDLCIQTARRADGGAMRVMSRVASPAMGRYVVISSDDDASNFSPDEIPIDSRIVELSNPIAVSKHNPFGFCEAVVYHHDKNTRAIYNTCDQKDWTARTELCHMQMQH